MGVEIGPQDDRRFVLLQEATGTTARVWGVRPDPTGLRASVDAYLERVGVQGNLTRFFQVVYLYVYVEVLGPDDMVVRGTCGHQYITKYVGRADLLVKRGRVCPECQLPTGEIHHMFQITDEYAEWFLAAEDEKRTRGYHCRSGNIPGAPGVEIYRQAFQAGKSPTEANNLYIQAEQVFLTREQESLPCVWCGTPVVGGIEQDGKRYCDMDCATWYTALQQAGLR